jgi:hypothetical protein
MHGSYSLPSSSWGGPLSCDANPKPVEIKVVAGDESLCGEIRKVVEKPASDPDFIIIALRGVCSFVQKAEMATKVRALTLTERARQKRRGG